MPDPLLFYSKCAVCETNCQPQAALCHGCLQEIKLRVRRVERSGLPNSIALADYDKQVAALLHNFKLTGNRKVANWIAAELALELSKHLIRPSILVPVPSAAKATEQRGFVPAFELAKAVSRKVANCKVFEGVWLNRVVADQAGLSAQDREDNLRGSMVAKPSLANYAEWQIVLVDDVITTGASMREMIRALSQIDLKPDFVFAFAETLRKSLRES